MKIPPVTPVIRAHFSRHFSHQTQTNRRHKMSNNTDNTTQESNENEDIVTTTIPMEFTAKLNVPQEMIDEANKALNRFKWQMGTILGIYAALVTYSIYLEYVTP